MEGDEDTPKDAENTLEGDEDTPKDAENTLEGDANTPENAGDTQEGDANTPENAGDTQGGDANTLEGDEDTQGDDENTQGGDENPGEADETAPSVGTGETASENTETDDAGAEDSNVQQPDAHNPKVTMTASDYDAENGVITYTVVVEAEGDMDYTVTEGEDETSKQYPVVIEDLTSVAGSDLVFDSGSYTYEHKKELADELPQSQVTDNAEVVTDVVTDTATDFTGFPLTVAHMYDGDTITLNYTARVLSATYSAGQASTRNIVTIHNSNPANDSADDSDTVTSAFAYKPLEKTRTSLEGSWATWEVKVNPKGFRLNDGNPLTLRDTFALTHKDESGNDVSDQSIDYASIEVVSTDNVTYDYRGNTGSFVIPDGVSVTIRYRTRITAQPGEEVTFGNYAELLDLNETQIDEVELSQTETIFPSASEVDAASGLYMVKLYVYGDGNMQTGISGAKFVLLDANRRPMKFKKGDNAGQDITFTTDDDGYADIRLDEESGDVSIQKNTAYYLEMIKAPSGYKRDNTLYNFMITDNPNYNSGGAWTYFNGDTIKVRLYKEEASLNVSMRFSGNYSLNSNQQNAVEVILQKKTDGNSWEEVERHAYTEFSYGSLTFEAGKDFAVDETYRVIQENQRPWDLGSAVILNTTYYLIIGAGDSQQDTNPKEFTVTGGNIDSSFNIVINNEYEEPKLTLTKMDKETGETLSGAVFTVRRAGDDETIIKTYTTDKNGEIVISGGADFQSETLYYVVEATPPAGYLLPLNPEKFYFYFCNDDYFLPTILGNLPEGETAVNLSETYENQTVDNQRERITIPVMATWQGNAWPANVKNVTIGLYQSVGDAAPEPVLHENGEAMTVVLSGTAPYNNHAFTNLPARDDNQPIAYSIREERIDNTSNNDILDSYVQEYGVSDSGVYIVRNKPATTLTVNKEWYDLNGEKITDDETLREQSNVTFDIYRTTEKLSDEEIRADGVTNEEMSDFVSGLTKARGGVSFGHADGWTTSIRDLDKYSDDNKPYYYYVLETIPSFGDETYALTEADAPNYATHTVTIGNKIAPKTVSVTVQKAHLVDDPREDAPNTDFGFTLTLKKDSHVIRGYRVRDDLVTDWNGKATFTLKPEHSINLTLPVGVTATITEAAHPEYVEVATSNDIVDLDTGNGRVFQFDVEAANNNAVITYTATLRVVCKVEGEDGETPFESLKSALAYIRDHETFYHGTATIWLLEDYEKPDTDIFEIREGENITLTTAPTEEETPGARFHFRTSGNETVDTAVISRSGDKGSMFTNNGVLSLDKIILDGANVADTADAADVADTADAADAADGEDATNAAIIMDGDGGLVYNTGTLNLSSNTTLRNSSVNGKGGAVYSEGVVNMEGGDIVGNSATNGAAFYLESGALTMTGGNIHDNIAADDGAVTVYNPEVKVNLSYSPVIFDNRNVDGEWANVYIGTDSDNIINVVEPGLSSDAKIGVRAMETHREIGEQFATAEFEMTDNLTCFVNDQYEYRGKLKDGTSTNIVWDGLTLTIKKIVDPVGANANDRFTLTLTSSSIRKSSYIIDGSVDYTITAARRTTPGSIVLRNVQDMKGSDNNIVISSLPVGEYTIEEADSNYSSLYTGVNTELNQPIKIESGGFELHGDSVLTVTSARRLATVNLTKTLEDRLKSADEPQAFHFDITLTDADGTRVSNFTLADTIQTDTNGVVSVDMSPSNSARAERSFKVPVGATMRIEEETENADYRIITSAQTMPKEETQEETKEEETEDGTEGEKTEEEETENGTEEASGVAIEDMETETDNIFVFPVTDDGANVTFFNVRNMAEITLSKELENKVSATESFTFTVTLTRDGKPAANYVMCGDITDSENNIRTNANGQAVIPLEFSKGVSSQSVTLNIPYGTKMVVEETKVTKVINKTAQEIYDTYYSIDGGPESKNWTATINSVSDANTSIAFRNRRKTQTVTVENKVSGYSGNTEPFTFTATVTDGGWEEEVDYNVNGFSDGERVFELAKGQNEKLTVPYGATLKIAETFKVGYETTINNVTTRDTEFTVTGNPTVTFTNTQLINLVLENRTTSTLENVQVYVGYGTRMYRVNDEKDNYTPVNLTNHWATISVEAGKTAFLEVNHEASQTAEQAYTVKGVTPADGYYYKISNEPSFHEFADPAVLRLYNTRSFEVKGKLRYSPADSTVTFTEQPLVSFDVNGGAWTTEMDGYNDRDGDRKVYQVAVNVGEKAPTPDAPIYPTAEEIAFLGWTPDKDFAEESHTADEDISDNAYNFDAPVTVPLTLYAVWTREARNTRIVTVKNACNELLTVNVTLSNADAPGNYALANDVTTDASGQASFTLSANATKNLNVPNGATLKLETSGDCIAYSTDFTDADNVDQSFTITPVKQDGVVAFIRGVCKITDADGNTLYKDSKPAVYKKLSEAFAAYSGTFDGTSATPAAVEMLVDEYHIQQSDIPKSGSNNGQFVFPNASMTLTTADSDDATFPYVGARTRTTIYRYGGNSKSCFYLTDGTVTLTNIILDGGSKLGRNAEKETNGGLINVSGGTLNITNGATLRNCEFTAYTDSKWGRGGAVYLNGGVLNVDAGLFSNCHARRGGAICAESSATLNITGADGSLRFENCKSDNDDGGAIYYNASHDLSIDGGADKDNPGILFTSCVALTGSGDGGAIFANAKTEYLYAITVSGCGFTECSARNNSTQSTTGLGGGAISAYHMKALTVSDCAFNACDTLCSGGAVVAYIETNESVSISNCSFESCNCKAQGGAVGVYQKGTGDKNSTTTLSIVNCSFNNCSSGTENGSGGAIQCYLPCMEFTGSRFADCWAGKEGGAVNNYFGGSIGEMWPNSRMKVDNCQFIRCRAEDRYETTGPVHYGGGINTKVVQPEVKNSYFEDCVSTLKEGGALHFCGLGAGSQAKVENSVFKNCTAESYGGALMAANETLEVSGSKFYGCGSLSNNGGAVCHNRSARTDSTQKTTKIDGCFFGPDPESDSAENPGCSAAQSGGAVWTRAQTVTIKDCQIDNCTANGNGGGAYLSNNKSTAATISGGSITGCQAIAGSAVYAEYKTTFSGGEMKGNAVSDINSGAVHGVKLYFEGDVRVEENPCSADSAYMHDVLLQNNNVTTIYTTDSGLGELAYVGVYVSDSNNAYANRGQEGQSFGTHGTDDGEDSHGANYLDGFFNDRNDSLFGYKPYEDGLIYWGTYVCKITDTNGVTLKRPNGRDAVYQRLTMALDDFTKVSGGVPVYVKMLVEEYNIRQEEPIDNFPDADITLTTAGKQDENHPYRGAVGTVCTISRSNSDDSQQLFKLKTSGATFQLENITLDGRGNFRLIEAEEGAVVIRRGATLQYGSAAHGGAIYAKENATVTVNGVYDEEKAEASVKFLNCVSTGNGGAINAVSLTIDNPSNTNATGEYGAAFMDCNADSGGAVYVSGADTKINDAVFINCHSASEGGAVFHNNTNDNTTTAIENSSFTNCYAGTDTQNANGGAVRSKAATLTVESSGFVNCYALLNGGAIHHGAGQSEAEENDRLKTTIVNSTFEHCEAQGEDAYGGSVYAWAKEVALTNCSIDNSVAGKYGGALYCQSDDETSNATVSGSSFDSCSVTQSAGAGGAIYAKVKTLTLQKTESGDAASINNCTAPGFSGAVYMETDDSVLNINDGVKISGCYAKQGGAIYLKEGVTLNLTGSPEFTENGYLKNDAVDAEQGACIYLAEGSRITLSGAPKFSRNYLIYHDRITNGGTKNYVRQDLYLAGYSGQHAESIHVAGELTGDTIWVWPEKSPHRLHGKQFATTETSVSGASLGKFRNALADTETGCSYGEYLAGMRLADKKETDVYWNKVYNISFNKKDNKGEAVAGAEFTLYTDSACSTKFLSAVSADGEEDTNVEGELLNKGVVDFTAVPIGVYYMRETIVPESFRAEDIPYLVLVGSPSLAPNENNTALWHNGGPLDVYNAATLVLRYTMDSGKYFGIFPLENGKATLRGNIASPNMGIINIRNNYDISFMKTDTEGVALPDAEFTLYAPVLDGERTPKFDVDNNNYPEMTRYLRDGEEYPSVKSADGKTKYNGATVEKGLVCFRDLPKGSYYLVESYYPGRNGDNRIAYFVESDRVFKLDVRGDKDFTLSEWKTDGTFTECVKDSANKYYVVKNTQAVCKLTDGAGNLLYERSLSGGLNPAIYATLEAGFNAAQNHTLYNADGDIVIGAGSASLKLQVLKDVDLPQPQAPIIYRNSERALTFTTASRTATSADRYTFSPGSRTSDTYRAEIKRAYNEDTSSNANAGALITVADGANLTLQNINLNGQKNAYNGRAIHVTQGSLTIQNSVKIQNFKQEAASDSTDSNDIKGGAVLLDDNTTLTVNGGSSRTAEFSNNEVLNHRSDGSTGADGGAIAIGKNCEVSFTNAQFLNNKALSDSEKAGNGGAVSVTGTADAETPTNLSFKNAVFRYNSASYQGGALRTAENCDLTVENSEFTGNQANTAGGDGDGGAIAALSKEDAPSTLRIIGGVFKSNSANGGDGGAVKIGGYGTLSMSGSLTISENSAKNGGAVTAAPYAKVTFASGTMSGNTATEGSAFYMEDNASLTVSGGTVTGNKASGDNGGAINAGGVNAKLYFSGSPCVFNNTSATDSNQQRNVVLSYDNNALINTTANGLNANALIGVYVIGGTREDLFKAHGLPGAPFGTFGDTDKLNPQTFRNDRNLALYGVKNESDDLIYWSDVICKLTDTDRNPLYQNISFLVNGKLITCKAPAVYDSVQGGFNAAQGTLYNKNNSAYAGFTGDKLRLEMLKDAALSASVEYKGSRAVTFTTAETDWDKLKSEDCFLFKPNEDRADGTDLTKALITRAFNNGSMIKATGEELTLSSITLDGMKDSIKATGNGGVVYVANGAELTINPGAVLQNSAVTGNGGAAYIANGGVATVTGGEINHNESDGDGAGFYLAQGGKLYLSGSPDFGGKGTDNDGNILYDSGNWKQGAPLTDVKNGGKTYTKARQDIFIAGYAGNDDSVSADSLIVNGDITSPDESTPVDGSIWVWAEKAPRYKTMCQFGKFQGSITNLDDSLKAFRNAQDDKTTGYKPNPSYAYLDGVTGDEPGCIYWRGESMEITEVGERTVILRKIGKTGDTFEPLAGAVFVYDDGTEELLESSGANGIFFIRTLSFGTYYLKETQAPDGYSTNQNKWFCFIVDGDGVWMSGAKADKASALADAQTVKAASGT